ncbi:MAG TPA: DUF2127 domain-containing protein [Polyangiaceae bacterium]|nr:DUF2127 domain-containing protein [Polyangiaceae bacterium]
MQSERGGKPLLAIAVFKLLKATVLVGIGVAAWSLARDSGTWVTLQRVAEHLKLGPDNRLVDRALGTISGLDDTKLEELGLGTFVYAAVFLTEGVGLVLRKHWAEYLTTAVTASFIPFEVYELTRGFSPFKLAGLAVNVAILVYLVVRLEIRLSRTRPQTCR